MVTLFKKLQHHGFFKIQQELDFFFILFTFARLVSLIKTNGFTNLHLLIAGILVFANPRFFIVFLPLSLLNIWQEMPDVFDHALLMLIAGLPLIFFMPVGIYKNGLARWQMSMSQSYLVYLRYLIIIFYFAVFFHKLNYDFITPSVSCAKLIYYTLIRDLNLQLETLPEWLPSASITLTYIIEGLLPLLLLNKRSFKYALLGLVFFHFLLTTDFLRFSSTMLCLNSVFILGGVSKKFSDKKIIDLILVGCFFILSYVILTKYLPIPIIPNSIKILFYLLFGSFWFAGLFNLFKTSKNHFNLAYSHSFKFSYYSFFYKGLLIIPISFAIMPYIGLKTSGVFSIYSNFKSSGATSNHLLLPTVEVFKYQSDLAIITDIKIVGSSDNFRGRLKNNWLNLKDSYVPFFELKRRAQKIKNLENVDIFISYKYLDKIYEGINVKTDSILQDENNWLLNKILKFSSFKWKPGTMKNPENYSCARLNSKQLLNEIEENDP